VPQGRQVPSGARPSRMPQGPRVPPSSASQSEVAVAFAFSEYTRSTLRSYGLTDEQVQHVERVEGTERDLARTLRRPSLASRLRSAAKGLERSRKRSRVPT
jgi:hypothetical protein